MTVLADHITAMRNRGSSLYSARPEAISGYELAPVLTTIDDNLDPLVATPARATGSITLTANALFEFNKEIVVGDGVRTLTIPYVSLGGTENKGYTLDVGGVATLESVGARLQAIIETYLNIKVTRTVGALTLENRRDGVGGNVTITTTLVNATVAGMTGGVGPDPFEPATPGSVTVFTMPFAQQPTTGDSVTIGVDKYEFVTAGGQVADDGNIGVAIGASAAETLTNWINAINAVNEDNEHANLLMGDGTTPALANGTESFRADAVGTTLRVRSAAAPGSTEIVGSAASVTLAENLTHATLVWNEGNVNVNTLGGSYPSSLGGAMQAKAITAAMVTAGEVRFAFPFRVGAFQAQIRTATNLLRDAPVTDTFELDNGDVLLTLTSTDASDVDAGDIVTVFAFPA